MGASIKIIKQACCLSDIDGSCFKFYPREFDGGIIHCEKCFDMICDNSPVLCSLQNKENTRKLVWSWSSN